MKCLNCGTDIPLDHAQVGGVHMLCEHEYFHVPLRMVKMRPKGGGQWLIQAPNEVVHTLESSDLDSEYELQMTTMTKHEINSLAEFDGW